MPITDTRVRPMALVRVYETGGGDPVCVKPWWGWYDILVPGDKGTAHLGLSSTNAAGVPLLAIEDNVGIACRPFLVAQDTLLAQFATSGGTWGEKEADTGSRRTYRLSQTNSAANTTWSATSAYAIPENAHFAISLLLNDPPTDHDADVQEPAVRFEWGEIGGQAYWAIEFHPSEGIRLLGWVEANGTWKAIADIPNAEPPAGVDRKAFKEIWVWVRHHRGKIRISSDFGRSYTEYGNPDGTDARTEASPFTLRGYGRSAVFGLHQIVYYTGTYTSPERQMWRHRTVAAAITPIWQWGADLPTAPAYYGTVEGADLADYGGSGAGAAQYRLTLTPASVVCVPFTFFYSPECQAVKTVYTLEYTVETGVYQEPFENKILKVQITRPWELDGDAATVETRYTDDFDPYTFANAAGVTTQYSPKWRKCSVLLGDLEDDGSLVLVERFRGYLQTITAQENDEQPQDYNVAFSLANGTMRAKDQQWDDSAVPLGGMTVNAAIRLVWEACGIPSGAAYNARFNLHASGDTITLPTGNAEDPFLWPKAGDLKWRTLQDICEFAGLEMGADAGGVIYTVEKDYTAAAVTHTWLTTLQTSLDEAMNRLSHIMDSSESKTGIILRGTDWRGNAIWAGVVSSPEDDPAALDHSPWPSIYADTFDGTMTSGILSQRVAGLSGDLLGLHFEVDDLTAPVKADINRRDRVTITGARVGFADATEWCVRSVQITYTADPSYATCETQVALRLA